ncbi:YceI family protein [Corynebacterium bovis]|uniref:Polyisoprenoid-binding protein n=2 Tax=Corynebacterium bovis TaxID=36808 RepID=A0A3R8PPM2_9CORY|nr:YceI family protein [Corynebacterium bovis]MBB3115919.1 polyisoprenoid-binding protein YceI [Corynebacterium bovis DSM 20582 = CIP 54.80]MDN8579803.1 YceI family protein [Corynebacterium bovis]QQC46879.1 polyisoprenoid-binding protein [Corynebacterium bovis]RRO79439.1 polyisoprenoid-binding protein [Corynebacterium bovis]RRO79643.1 polyisoprenoid-binding protein [Corynebacterium bovis]
MSSVNDFSGTYTIDPSHSEIEFVARHAMISKVRGSFDSFEGTATTGPNLEDAKIELSIDVNSIDTRNKDRDGHLLGEDFFDAEKYPKITFVSTSVTAKDDSTLSVTGDLTVKGETNPVTVEFDFGGDATDPWGNLRVGFEGKAEINRRDFGLTWQTKLDNGGALVSEKIGLHFDISATKNA